jgi:hypothetical protein
MFNKRRDVLKFMEHRDLLAETRLSDEKLQFYCSILSEDIEVLYEQYGKELCSYFLNAIMTEVRFRTNELQFEEIFDNEETPVEQQNIFKNYMTLNRGGLPVSFLSKDDFDDMCQKVGTMCGVKIEAEH